MNDQYSAVNIKSSSLGPIWIVTVQSESYTTTIKLALPAPNHKDAAIDVHPPELIAPHRLILLIVYCNKYKLQKQLSSVKSLITAVHICTWLSLTGVGPSLSALAYYSSTISKFLTDSSSPRLALMITQINLKN